MKKYFSLLVLVITILVVSSGCSSLERAKKDMKSEYGGGLNRVLKVYSADGKLIQQYEGKFDIEKSTGKVKFIENGKVHIIYLGNSSTVVVDEE